MPPWCCACGGGIEVGVARFVPLLTRRSLVRPSAACLARWRRIAVEAAKQSRRPTVPEVTDPQPLPALWAGERAGPLLQPWEEERAGIGEMLPRLGPVRAVTVAVAPEGGFAPEEVAEARAPGAGTVSLGATILRTETAAVVTVAMVLYEVSLRHEVSLRRAEDR
jgi:16S rRNA (uracil1498-N3)-methyltransferase